jgi:hypothetical protein
VRGKNEKERKEGKKEGNERRDEEMKGRKETKRKKKKKGKREKSCLDVEGWLIGCFRGNMAVSGDLACTVAEGETGWLGEEC